MGKVIYDQEVLGLMNFLSSLTHARVKDCFKEEDTVYCVVEKGDIGLAIGKGGANIQRISQTIKKKIRIIEYGETPAKLVRNLIYPTKVEDVVEKEGLVEIVGGDKQTKGLLIGRDSKNLKFLNKVVQRFFKVEVKVV